MFTTQLETWRNLISDPSSNSLKIFDSHTKPTTQTTNTSHVVRRWKCARPLAVNAHRVMAVVTWRSSPRLSAAASEVLDDRARALPQTSTATTTTTIAEMRKILWRASMIIWMILKVMSWSAKRVAIMLHSIHPTFQRCPTPPPQRHFRPHRMPPRRRSAMRTTTQGNHSISTIRRIHRSTTTHRPMSIHRLRQHRPSIRRATLLRSLHIRWPRRIAILQAATTIDWRRRLHRQWLHSTAKTLVWHPNIIKNLIAFILISCIIIITITIRYRRSRSAVSFPILMRWMRTTVKWISIWKMESSRPLCVSIRWRLNSSRTARWQSSRRWVITRMRVRWNSTRIHITQWTLEFIRCNMKLEVMDRRQQFCHVWVIGIIMFKAFFTCDMWRHVALESFNNKMSKFCDSSVIFRFKRMMK